MLNYLGPSIGPNGPITNQLPPVTPGTIPAGIPSSRLRHLSFKCGKVPVPLDYDMPNGPTIDITHPEQIEVDVEPASR